MNGSCVICNSHNFSNLAKTKQDSLRKFIFNLQYKLLHYIISVEGGYREREFNFFSVLLRCNWTTVFNYN